MINELLAWLTDLWDQHPWLTAASGFLGIVTAAAGVMSWLHGRMVNEARRIRREKEEENEQLKADVIALKSEVKRLRERLPEAAWGLAERERLDDNEESAIRALRRHMDTEGARLSEMARQISRFHLGLVTERDRDRHLIPGERFALLAFHLDPRNGEAGQLLKEVQQLRGDPFEHVQFTDDVFMANDDADAYYALPQTPDAVVSLLRDADKAIDRGHYRHALALAEIVFLSARRALGNRQPMVLAARYVRAAALKFLGRCGEALAEIDGTEEQPGILCLHEQSPDLGPTHSSTLSARWQRADILHRLGRHTEALAEMDGTEERPGILSLDEQSPDSGPGHRHTLTSRWLRADILRSLGRDDEALAEIDGTEEWPGILSLQEKSTVVGPTHPDTLTTRCLRGDILGRLGRDDEALAEIDGTEERVGILPLQERSADLGPTHPYTLATRALRPGILQRLGRHDEALAEIDGSDARPGILSLREQSPDLGPTHPSTLNTRSLRGEILRNLGQLEESERELRSVGAAQEKVLGPFHASTLRTGHRLASTLIALGRFGEAEEVLRAVIAGHRDSLRDEHPETRAAVADLEAIHQRRAGGPVS